MVVDDRAGIPFVIDAVRANPARSARAVRAAVRQPNTEVANWARSHGIDADPKADELELWPKIIMGFCGKNVEVADQLLQEGDRDHEPSGAKGCGSSA